MRKAKVEAETSDAAVRKLAAERDHAAGITYNVEPEDNLGYAELITLESRQRER